MLRHIFVVQNMILCTFAGKTSRYVERENNRLFVGYIEV